MQVHPPPNDQFENMQKIRVFESFAGYGSQAIAAKRLQQDFPDDVQFEFVGISEIEPSAIKAYHAIHGDVHNYGDITKIDWSQVPDFDLFTMSSPCQDFSQAGKQAGGQKEAELVQAYCGSAAEP